MPDDDHGDPRYIVMKDVVDAAEADGATMEQTSKNLEETLRDVLVGKLTSKHYPKK